MTGVADVADVADVPRAAFGPGLSSAKMYVAPFDQIIPSRLVAGWQRGCDVMIAGVCIAQTEVKVGAGAGGTSGGAESAPA